MSPPVAIPTREDCLRLMRERLVVEHIIEHSLRVAQVATLLGRSLLVAGEWVDLPLIEAASLLHDIAKLDSLKAKTDHALAGQELVVSLGFAPALGQAIRYHVRLPEDGAACPPEWKIVNYSDKRVNGTLIVTLRQRFDYIRERYGHTAEIIARINRLEERTRELERRLFARLPFGPEQLEDYLLEST